MNSLTVVDHPVARHLLSQLRDRDTQPSSFRSLSKRIAAILAVEATRDLSVRERTVTTPMETTIGNELIMFPAAVPILRAGLGMLDAFVELLPDLRVGYIGLERDEATAIAVSYYAKLPPDLNGAPVFILDPMLATGGWATKAITLVKAAGAGHIVLVCVVAAPEGVAAVHLTHPDTAIVSAALDRELNDRMYILPGLGDYGDRLYGTL